MITIIAKDTILLDKVCDIWFIVIIYMGITMKKMYI